MNTIDTSKRRPDWRTQETHDAYIAVLNDGHLQKGCPLCTSETLVEFTHWRLTGNRFPYDRVAEVHHMIVPKRHTDGEDLSGEEKSELAQLLKTDLNTRGYNYFMQSLPSNMSIPAHLHYHLIKARNFD
jgi:diadenosine tetraphosphate (Ap4A) HIT family hydrolase